MTIFLTGAAGFIGWKVCELLVAEGHAVIGVDNLNRAYDARLKEWRLARLRGKPGFEFHHVDICDRQTLHSLFTVYGSRFHAVINLAARAGVRQSVEDPWVYFETNVTGTLNLLELCREFGVRKFVLASTSSLYGEGTIDRQAVGGQRPAERRLSTVDRQGARLEPRTSEVERLSHALREDQPTDHPLSPYAASKKAAEVLCHTYHYLYGIDTSVLRYFTVYGPAGRPDMSLFRFVQWVSEGRPVTVYGDGRQSRDFTYVDDIGRGTVAALKPLGYEIINLGSDQPVVLNDALRLVESLVGSRAKVETKPRHPADVFATWADIGKAKRLLGWSPEVRFEDGLAELVRWYRENRDWAKEIRTD